MTVQKILDLISPNEMRCVGERGGGERERKRKRDEEKGTEKGGGEREPVIICGVLTGLKITTKSPFLTP